jgi:hypothetical protein
MIAQYANLAAAALKSSATEMPNACCFAYRTAIVDDGGRMNLGV